jgi:hypothetical protein
MGQFAARIFAGSERSGVIEVIRRRHYTASVPSGKSYYVGFGDASVVWSLPANNNLAKFLLGGPGTAWELSRLWAPDGHDPNLLSQAISHAVRIIKELERPDILVSYSDPNAGHSGGVYRAASWIYHGRSEESRMYVDSGGKIIPRRAFHSGKSFRRKAEIEALGFREIKLAGKDRFVKPVSRKAKAIFI